MRKLRALHGKMFCRNNRAPFFLQHSMEWGFLSRNFKQHKRYVDGYGWTDYDNTR